MNRDLRFYFLVIGLPALLLALGGLQILPECMFRIIL